MTDAQTATPAAGKSIIDPKYRDKSKQPDWLAKFIEAETGKTREKTVTTTVGDEKQTSTTTVPDGVDVDKLFTLAQKNGLDVSKYVTQRENHGFAGRFRMTVRNMLQATTKQRHGLFNVGGTFTPADPAWLADKKAPAEPTHTQTGEKIAKAKPPAEAAAASGAASN